MKRKSIVSIANSFSLHKPQEILVFLCKTHQPHEMPSMSTQLLEKEITVHSLLERHRSK